MNHCSRSLKKPNLRGLVHDLAYLLRVGLRETAPEDGEVLAEHEHWSPVDFASSSHLGGRETNGVTQEFMSISESHHLNVHKSGYASTAFRQDRPSFFAHYTFNPCPSSVGVRGLEGLIDFSPAHASLHFSLADWIRTPTPRRVSSNEKRQTNYFCYSRPQGFNDGNLILTTQNFWPDRTRTSFRPDLMISLVPLHQRDVPATRCSV